MNIALNGLQVARLGDFVKPEVCDIRELQGGQFDVVSLRGIRDSKPIEHMARRLKKVGQLRACTTFIEYHVLSLWC